MTVVRMPTRREPEPPPDDDDYVPEPPPWMLEDEGAPSVTGNNPIPARPQIVLGPDISRVVDDCIRALASRAVFQREGALVDIVQSATTAEDGIVRADGTPRIRFLPTARLREIMTDAIDFKKRVFDARAKDWTLQSVPPPAQIVTTLEARGQWDHIRPLHGIVRWPVLRADGSVCTTPGYDARTGLIYEPTCDVTVLESPTLDDARAAIADLYDLVSDFPFAAPMHRSAWLACLLSLLGRAAISGPCPMTLIDASERGSGKSLLADVIGAIVLGKPIPRRTQCESPEEWKKAMLAIAIAADPIILIDNVTKTLRSDVLDAVLTGTEFRERVLGRNEELTLKVRTVFITTANNATLSADLVRRSLHVRLEPETERPEQRTGFRYPQLLEHIAANRARYLSAALTVLRAYFTAGKPEVSIRPMGSYEAWSRVVRSALVWAGEPDPAETQDELREGADTESETVAAFVGAWHEMYAERAVTVAVVLGNASDPGPLPPAEQAMRDAICALCDCDTSKLPSARRLGARLRGLRGKVVRGILFEQAKEAATREGHASWRTRRVR